MSETTTGHDRPSDATRTRLVSVGFLIPDEPVDGKIRWLESTNSYSEWDAEFADVLDYISGVNDEGDLTAFLRAEGSDDPQASMEDLVEAGILLRIVKTDDLSALTGWQVVGAHTVGDTWEDGGWSLGSSVGGDGARVGYPMMLALMDHGHHDIPTLMRKIGEDHPQEWTSASASESFLADLDLLLGGRCGFLAPISDASVDADPIVFLVGLPTFDTNTAGKPVIRTIMNIAGDYIDVAHTEDDAVFIEFLTGQPSLAEFEAWVAENAPDAPADLAKQMAASRRILILRDFADDAAVLAQFAGLRLYPNCDRVERPADQEHVDGVAWLGNPSGHEGEGVALPTTNALADALFRNEDFPAAFMAAVAADPRVTNAEGEWVEKFRRALVVDSFRSLPSLLASGYVFLGWPQTTKDNH